MLQHLRSTALKSFKTRLEKTMKEKQGDGFEESVDNCGWVGMLEFERGCEGNVMLYMHISSVFLFILFSWDIIYIKTWDIIYIKNKLKLLGVSLCKSKR
jgi:hypothetical protein